MMQPDWKKPMLVENKYLLPDPAYGEVKELIVIIGEAVVINSLEVEEEEAEEGEQEDDEEEKDEEGDLDLRSHKNCHCLSKKLLLAEVAMHESASAIVAGGALIFKNGNNAASQFIVYQASTEDVWGYACGDETHNNFINGTIPLVANIDSSEPLEFITIREETADHLRHRDRFYVVEGFAGVEEIFRVPVRAFTSQASHALLMKNMLVPPKEAELEKFRETQPYLIFNASGLSCRELNVDMTSMVAVSFERKEMVILGTDYAGEMEKGVFAIMSYEVPRMPNAVVPQPSERALILHASANRNASGVSDVSIFLGSLGTGKTTLSADPKRELIGDGAQVWHTRGVFNIKGGCHRRVPFGTFLEDVGFKQKTQTDDDRDRFLSEDMLAVYPCISDQVSYHGQPKQILFLTRDTFGVLLAVAKLTYEQAFYYYLSGYTGKTQGSAPEATFSACYEEEFLACHPVAYAETLVAKLQTAKANAYLVNTGWVGGPCGVGERCSVGRTMQIIDAIHEGTLSESVWEEMPILGLKIPRMDGRELLWIDRPEHAWGQAGKTSGEYEQLAKQLARSFQKNFEKYAKMLQPERYEQLKAAGPKA